MVLYLTDCAFCAHYKYGRWCEAYPEGPGIPDPIWTGARKHIEPFEGDHGITFLDKRTFTAAELAEWEEAAHARDDRGRFTSGGDVERYYPSDKVYGQGTADDPYRTSDINKAAELLAAGNHVDFPSEDRAVAMIDELANVVKAMKESGDPAAVFDLCRVYAEGVNLFCAENKGIARLAMPQLSGVPVPGSEAASMPAGYGGNVDVTMPFIEYGQKELGWTVEDRLIEASHLKATQTELNGGTVSSIADLMLQGIIKAGPAGDPIVVSKDNYIVDGHHRWAAQAFIEMQSRSDNAPVGVPVRVLQVDQSISELLIESNRFAAEIGIPQVSAAHVKLGERTRKGGCAKGVCDA